MYIDWGLLLAVLRAEVLGLTSLFESQHVGEKDLRTRK